MSYNFIVLYYYQSYIVCDRTYFMKFSSRSRTPPIESNKNAQFTKPVKSSNPEVQENKESLGL